MSYRILTPIDLFFSQPGDSLTYRRHDSQCKLMNGWYRNFHTIYVDALYEYQLYLPHQIESILGQYKTYSIVQLIIGQESVHSSK